MVWLVPVVKESLPLFWDLPCEMQLFLLSFLPVLR